MHRQNRTALNGIAALAVALVALGCGLPTPTTAPPTVAATQPPPTATAVEPPPAPLPTEPPVTTTIPPLPSPSPPPPPPTTPPTPPPPTPECTVLPEGVFLTIWQSDPARQAALGCPISHHPRVQPAAWEVQTAYQSFEHGAMIWSNQIGWYDQPVVYILYADATFRRVEDTFDPDADPVSGGETPPAGLFEPILGFGKTWREEPGVRAALGWATAEETPGAGRFQIFMGGDMIWLSQRQETCVLLSDSTYVVTSSSTFE